jgi:hypothetical protein
VNPNNQIGIFETQKCQFGYWDFVEIKSVQIFCSLVDIKLSECTDCSLIEQIPWVLVSVGTIGVGVGKFKRRDHAYLSGKQFPLL